MDISITNSLNTIVPVEIVETILRMLCIKVIFEVRGTCRLWKTICTRILKGFFSSITFPIKIIATTVPNGTTTQNSKDDEITLESVGMHKFTLITVQPNQKKVSSYKQWIYKGDDYFYSRPKSWSYCIDIPDSLLLHKVSLLVFIPLYRLYFLSSKNKDGRKLIK